MAGAYPTSAIVLAGGQSRRFGKNKAEVQVAGKTLLEWVLDVISPLFDDIVLVGGVPELSHTQSGEIRILEDEIPGVGPLGGLYTGLGAIRRARALCVACDMPLLTPELISRLLEVRSSAAAVVFRHGAQVEPLCALYARMLRPVIRQQIEARDYRMHSLLERIRPAYVDLEDSPETRRRFRNVNTVSDLALVEGMLQEKPVEESTVKKASSPD